MNSLSLIVYRGRAGDRNPRGTRGAQLLGLALARRFNLPTTFVSTPQPPLPSTLWDEQLSAARADLRAFADAMTTLFGRGERCVSAMGRCAAGLATIPVVVRHHPDACIVWFDAHGDSNLPSSNTVPYLGGMVITGAAGHWDSGLGSGLSLSNVVLVGARDLDPHEKQLIASGVLKVVEPGPKLVERLSAAVGSRDVYVHLDCDVLEPGLVPIEYQVPGGLSFEDLRACAEELRRRRIIGLEISEFESEWLDGRPGSPERLVDAIAPLLG
ncbi:MAG TPA: arginase family protein [Steroidobacteraceae bacterium]|jgi:arginase|nr:arginase family protein [Steroidobacteraceae bacterium]